MKAKPDLLALTFDVMRQQRCTYREARAILGQRGAASRNRRRTAIERERARLERMRLD